MTLRYGGCGIDEVNTLPFIASSEPVRLVQAPPSITSPSLEIGFDGWVLPQSGVAFVWTLQNEQET